MSKFGNVIFFFSLGYVKGDPRKPNTGGNRQGHSRSLGCFGDSGNDRAFPKHLGAKDLSLLECAEQCASGGYDFFGYQNQNECWCGLWSTLEHTFNRHDRSNKCKNGKGGNYAFDAYKISNHFDGYERLKKRSDNSEANYSPKIAVFCCKTFS